MCFLFRFDFWKRSRPARSAAGSLEVIKIPPSFQTNSGVAHPANHSTGTPQANASIVAKPALSLAILMSPRA